MRCEPVCGFMSMTLDQIINSAVVIATFVSAIGTLLTVRQMAQQREASYRPELVFSRMRFKGSQNAGLAGKYWDWSNSDIVEKTKASMLLSIPLRNVGLGAAKDISVSWSFPIEEMIHLVNTVAQRTLALVYLTYEKGVVSVESEKFGKGPLFWQDQSHPTLDCVLPASIQKEPDQVILPGMFMELAAIFLIIAAKEKDRTPYPEIPMLKACLKYRDIGDKSHTSNFEIKLDVLSTCESDLSIAGFLTPKKCDCVPGWLWRKRSVTTDDKHFS